LSERFYLTHRFRYEQRWVEDQDFRTRYRYNLFLNVPLNQKNLKKNAVYLSLYNEIFINGEREIGDGRSVELFDRNRFYSALGYALQDNLKVQAGYMIQATDNVNKGQIQLSLHHTF
jgi:outer membrane receptor for ferric coprogen and ferric-rhodotorulic acid